MSSGPLADWRLAERLAWVVGGSGLPAVSAAEAGALRADLEITVARADPVARAVTGLGADLPPASARVVGRRRWIADNLAAIAALTDPVADDLVRTSGLARAVARRGVAVQVGVVFGYLSTKVLGQYEVFHPSALADDSEPGRITLVGPNLVELERTVLPGSGVAPSQVRMGLCLHELAHRLQFEGVPWLRPRLRGILDAYLADARLEPEQVRRAASRARELLANPRELELQAVLDAVLTPRQRGLFDEAQTLMSLLEGHGNVVMDWGAEQLAADPHAPAFDPSTVRGLLNRRRASTSDSVLRKALGLQLKAAQYREGERFIFAVADAHGRSAFNRVWQEPTFVPTAEELGKPDTWVARVEAAAG